MVTNLSKHRFERKFLISSLDRHDVEHLVKLHPAVFSEVFYPRHVNNIYLDSHDLRNYWDNVQGSGQRQKVRVRWYGEIFGSVSRPVLELKIKSGFANWKESFPIDPFGIERGFNFEALINAFDNSDLPEHLRERLKGLEPTLLNRYRRRYYLSADGVFRITIDDDMEYSRIVKLDNRFAHTISDRYRTILELKYETSFDDQADSVSGVFPFRLTRSSKYVSGIDQINNSHG